MFSRILKWFKNKFSNKDKHLDHRIIISHYTKKGISSVTYEFDFGNISRDTLCDVVSALNYLVFRTDHTEGVNQLLVALSHHFSEEEINRINHMMTEYNTMAQAAALAQQALQNDTKSHFIKASEVFDS